MSSDSLDKEPQPRRHIIDGLANRFIKDANTVTHDISPVQALEITEHLLRVVDLLEQFIVTKDWSHVEKFHQAEEELALKWGRLIKSYRAQHFQAYFNPSIVLSQKEIISKEEYNNAAKPHEQMPSRAEMEGVITRIRSELKTRRYLLLAEQPPSSDALQVLSADQVIKKTSSGILEGTDAAEQKKSSEAEDSEPNNRFTKSRSRLALYFLVKAAGVEPRADSAVSALAKLAHLITGEKLSSINNSNTYKFYLGMPDYKTAKGRLADLQFVRPYFEDLSMERALKMIDEEITRAGLELPKHKGT